MSSNLGSSLKSARVNARYILAVTSIAGLLEAAAILLIVLAVKVLGGANTVPGGIAVAFMILVVAFGATAWMLAALSEASLDIARGGKAEYRSLTAKKGRFSAYGVVIILFVIAFLISFIARVIATYIARGESSFNLMAFLVLLAAATIIAFIVGGACFAFHAAVSGAGGPLASLRESRRAADGMRAKLALGAAVLSSAFYGLFMGGAYLGDLASRGFSEGRYLETAIGILGLAADAAFCAAAFGVLALSLGSIYSSRTYAPPLIR